MPIVKLEKKHKLGAEEAKRRVQGMEESLHQRYGLKVAWTGHRATFRGKAFAGSIDVNDDLVDIALSLGLAASPFAGRIRQQLSAEMSKAFQ